MMLSALILREKGQLVEAHRVLQVSGGAQSAAGEWRLTECCRWEFAVWQRRLSTSSWGNGGICGACSDTVTDGWRL